jgi:uncharacterized membrane protein
MRIPPSTSFRALAAGFLVALALLFPISTAFAAAIAIPSSPQEAAPPPPESPTPLVTRLLGIDTDNPSDAVVFLGRFHPLVVHLPIGLLLLAFLMEFLGRTKRFAELRPAVSFTLFLGALSALVSVSAGLLLAASGGYSGDDLWWHKWLGIGVAALAVVAYFYKRRTLALAAVPRTRTLYTASLLATVVVLTLASHRGGTLTHGEGYLSEYMPEPFRSFVGIPPRDQPDKEIVIENLPEAAVFADIIHPILDARCVGCHNPQKEKGELLLTTPEDIMKGGENGPVIASGNAGESELIRRVSLDPTHDDHMPPTGRRPLTDDQVALLSWWVDSGAPFDRKVAEVEVPTSVQSILDRLTEKEDETLAIQVPPADPEALERLAEAGILALPLSIETNLLQIQTVNARDRFADEQMALLEPVAEQIAWLNLGHTKVSDAGLAVAARFPNLSRLHLEKTAVTDAGLPHLQNLNRLVYLNLYGTAVTDAGIQHLEGLKTLESVYLWQTQATAGGAERLRVALPGAEVNMGLELTEAIAPADDSSSTGSD